MIPAGTHRAIAVTAMMTENSKGGEQAAVQFQFLDLEGNEKLTWFGHFTEKTVDSTLRGLRAAGWKGDDIMDLSSITKEPREVHVVVEHEVDDKGVPRAKIRWVNDPEGAPQLKALSSDKARQFQARMRGVIAQFNQAQGQPRNNGAPPRQQPRGRTGPISPEPPPNTDDLPF